MIGRPLVRFPARMRLLPSTSLLRCHQDRSARRPLLLALRCYATPGRPKKVVGEPSRPVKRAVKKAASTPSSGDSAAEKLVKSRSTAATKKKKKVTRRAKPSLTPEQKAAEKEKAALKKQKVKANDERQRLAAYRKLALQPPKVTKPNAWQMFLAEWGLSHPKGPATDMRQHLADTTREAAAAWKSISAADLEHYNHLATAKRESSNAEYKLWVESHTPEEIEQANDARKRLRGHERKLARSQNSTPIVKSALKWRAIHDERAVKRPISGYLYFSVNRHASGDFKNISIADRAKLIGAEWKALSEDEKKKYNALHAQDKDRYVSEYTGVHGHAPLIDSHGAEAVAAAA